jgi:hypothetical protein
MFGLCQFTFDHLLPLALAFIAVAPVWGLKRSWGAWAIGVPVLMAGALLIDAFLFHHRLAVEARAWQVFWDIDELEDTLRSPSGRSVVYVVGSHWLDSGYRVYLSVGRLFPYQAYIETTASNPSYPRDIDATWNGPLFTAGDGLPSVAFDERTGKLYTYDEWMQGARSAIEPPKTRETFSRYIQGMH